MDNLSRRILAWWLNDRFDPDTSADLLVEAGRGLDGTIEPPMLLADAGIENRNGTIDELVESGLLRRMLAMSEMCFSNALIEAWWRSLKHSWLFLNQLDSVARVRRLVTFYVEEQNAHRRRLEVNRAERCPACARSRALSAHRKEVTASSHDDVPIRGPSRESTPAAPVPVALLRFVLPAVRPPAAVSSSRTERAEGRDT